MPSRSDVGRTLREWLASLACALLLIALSVLAALAFFGLAWCLLVALQVLAAVPQYLELRYLARGGVPW